MKKEKNTGIAPAKNNQENCTWILNMEVIKSIYQNNIFHIFWQMQ